MGTHTDHRIHEHSRAAWRSLDLNERETKIMECVEWHGVQTDREIMEKLGYTDPNAVRPRVTELVSKGALIEYDEKRCRVTGQMVRRVYLSDQVRPREKPRSVLDALKEYFTTAERERMSLLRPSEQWTSAAESVRRVLNI